MFDNTTLPRNTAADVSSQLDSMASINVGEGWASLLPNFADTGYAAMRIFKSIKKAMAWFTGSVLLFGLLLFAGYVAIRSPYVQTRITQFVASKLSAELKTKVTVGGVDIGFFDSVILEEFYLEDLKGDTLSYIEKLHLTVNGFDLEKRQVLVKEIQLDSVYFHLRKYKGEQGQNIQFLIDYFKTEKDTTQQPVWDLRLETLQLVGATFKMDDYNKPAKLMGMDYRHLNVSNIDLLIKNIRMDHDTLFGRVDRLAVQADNGFVINHLAGDAKLSPVELKVDALRLKTPQSEVALNLHFRYSKWGDWLSFIDKVEMNLDLDNSEVSVQDVAYFAPALMGIDKTIRISGRISGPVASINGRALNIWYGRSTNLQGDIDMDGLPNIAETFMYLNLKRLVTNYTDLATIPIPPFDTKRNLSIPPNIATLGTMDFKGNFTGFMSDFVAYGKLNTSIGQMRTDLALKQDEVTKQFSYKGKLATTDFQVGTFLGNDKIGRVSLNASIDGKGITANDIHAKLEGSVLSAELLEYAYKNIEVNGSFVKNIFEGRFNINEENIALDFGGMVDLSGVLPRFNFHSEVAHANLYKLNFLKNRVDATVSGVLDVDFTGNDIDNLLGSIVLSKVRYQQKGDEQFAFNDFELIANQNGERKTIRLRSDIMDAEFVGKFAFRNIPKAINNIIAKHLPSYASEFQTLTKAEGLEFDFNAQIKNTAIVSYFVAPKLAISDKSHFEGSYSSSRNEISLTGAMPRLAFGTTVFNDVQVNAKNPGKEFELSVLVDDLRFTDSLFVANFEVRTFTFSDSLGLRILWNNNSKLENSADIQGVASFPRNSNVSFRLKESRITVADLDWTVVPNNHLTIDSSTFNFQNIAFTNGSQSIGLDGIVSKNPKEKLNVKLGTFDLANFNLITKKSGIALAGIISGNAQISNIYGQVLVTNQLLVDELKLNNVLIGSGKVDNMWEPETRTVNVAALLERTDGTGLRVSGKFMPGADRKQNFDLSIAMDRLPLSVTSVYIAKVLSEVEGTAKADLSLKGTTKEPVLEGYVDLNDASMLFNYLNTTFRISDRVLVKKDGFYFQNLKVLDERGKEGQINGWVKHTNFKQFRFDATLNANNFFAMNTTSALNPLYYGKAYGTGVVRFSGVPKQMHLELSMRTDKGSKFFIPLFGAKSVKASNFITFVKAAGTEEEKDLLSDFQVTFANLTMDLDIQVTPDAEVQLIFDPKVGDIIKGSGQGDIRMSLDRTGDFRMFGEFYITKGEYLFTLQNIINKKFSVKPGGSINWSGSPYQALVNLEAVYGLRTSLADLMGDTTYTKRVQVECVLKMTENLLNPNITFDINLPNADATAKADVINRIGVGNDQEMNRQVFALLVLNKFLPTEDQNIASETGGFFSANSAELLSNQLSNWLSRISNDFDVGLNYRPGSSTVASDEVEVALSTQLFNNRIVIDGNLGVANNRSPASSQGQSSSNIVGDVNIEYKITNDGKFRVRAFNRSNDVSANALVTNNAPFTQGVGISYRKEFNNFGDLFRSKKKSKSQPLDKPKLTPLLPEELDSDRMLKESQGD